MSSQAPRPPHPPPASPAIARVLPMVPEVSLFTHHQDLPSYPPGPSHSHQLTPPHLHPPPSQVLSPRPLLSLPPPSQVQPPRPHLPPSHHLLPQSDLSREFQRSEATWFLSGSSEIPVRRVQFQADRADQQHQAGAGQPHHARHHQAVDSPADKITFPHQVQQLHHHAVHHDQVQPLHSQVVKHQETVPPHRAVLQTHHQSHSAPQHSSAPPAAAAPHQLPPSIPPDIMSVLTWQNDQLAKLQDQVARLLAASPQGPVEHAGHLSPGQGGHPPAQAEAGCSPVLKRVSSSPTSRVTASTSTSTLFPDMKTPMGRLSEDRQPPPSPQPGACLDLPDYPTTPAGSTTSGQQMRRVGDMNTLDSPVLGESVSMYEGNVSDKGQEDMEEMYENILGQVKRLLAQDETNQQERQEDMPPVTTIKQHPIPPTLRQDTPTPPPTLRQAGHHPSHPADHPVPAQSATTATWDRLRQLGVSFISPSDLVQPAPSSSNPYNSFYPPQANIPSTTMVSPSPDTSLAINNLALKYLSDAELGKLAAQHNRQSRTPSRQETRPAEYSLASHQFLARYGLGGGHHGEQTQGAAGQVQDVLHRQPNYASPRPGNQQQYTPHLPASPQYNPPHLPARPQHSSPHPTQQPARAAAPAMDRVLDITAIRQQSRLW